MKKEIRILLLEDEIADAELVRHALAQSGLAFSLGRVETRDEFVQHLGGPPPGLILSDYHLPGFDGLAALEFARERLPDVPFIFVTGTLGEERAIETLRRGATDYVLKTRLHVLAPAVHRALREAEERAERRRAEERLRESSEQLRALSVHLQSVREEERTRIAREVHDELGQSLSGLKLDLAWFAGRLPRGPKELPDKISEMARRIDATILTVRRIATELRPGILDDLGLVAALEWQGKDFQNRTGIFCEVVAAVRDEGLDADRNTAFFRIFQETLTNIMRHAHATRVDVRLTHEPGRLVLTVQDNGRGITAAEIQDTGSIGLLGMGERAALLGGEVSFHGEPGRGTLVTVRIPLPGPRPRGVASFHENIDRRRSRRGAPGPEADPG